MISVESKDTSKLYQQISTEQGVKQEYLTLHGRSDAIADDGDDDDNDATTHATPRCTTQYRAEEMRAICRSNSFNKDNVSDKEFSVPEYYIFVDDRHKLLYCAVPKCGSTTFAQYLWDLHFPNPAHHRKGKLHYSSEFLDQTGIRRLGDLSRTERDTVTRDYFKFMVVRHPFDRMVSAWKHTFCKPNLSFLIQGKLRDIIDAYLKKLDPSREHDFDRTKEAITFAQFINLVSSNFSSGFKLKQFSTIYERCLPCHIKYDHIFRLETLSHDLTILKHHLKDMNENTKIPTITYHNQKRTRAGSEKLSALTMDYNNIRDEVTDRLQQVYHRDMILFGYQWARQKASCSWTNHTCC